MPTLNLEQRIERLEAIHAVQNLQARYEYLHSAHSHEDRLPLFALNTPGVRIELDWGAYEGREGVERFFLKYQALTHRPEPGSLGIHTLTTPVIEVAGDLQTAKAVWISPGVGAGTLTKGAPPEAGWMWVKYASDFVREDGEWKIWHLHVYLIFACPYNESWVDAKPRPNRRELPADCAPDRPSDVKFAGYAADRVYENIPAPPQPYQTFDPATAY